MIFCGFSGDDNDNDDDDDDDDEDDGECVIFCGFNGDDNDNDDDDEDGDDGGHGEDGDDALLELSDFIVAFLFFFFFFFFLNVKCKVNFRRVFLLLFSQTILLEENVITS